MKSTNIKTFKTFEFAVYFSLEIQRSLRVAFDFMYILVIYSFLISES